VTQHLNGDIMEFDLEDIKPALQVQVVAGMHFDRRVFLVADTGDKRPVVIALTPHQAASIAADLVNQSGPGQVYDRDRPVHAAVVIRATSAEPRRRPDGD
jgi:hypothetical protein